MTTNSTQLFSADFSQADAQSIADEIKNETGYQIFEQALTPEALNGLLESLPSEQVLVNDNRIGYVKAYSSNYFSHTLAVSRNCFDIVTSENIRAICRKYFDKPFRISNQRIYETHTASHLPWHTDNNLQDGNAYKGKHDLPGLMFLFYLSDVGDTNPFQLIPFSQTWSHQNNAERFFKESYIEEHYGEEVVSVRAPKGTLIICNSKMIHRAKPFNNHAFKRLTLLFQVDEVSDEYAGHGENILINTSFVTNRDPEVLDYLGFGMRANYPAFPETSVATMMPRDMLALQKQILPKAIKGLTIALTKRILPGSLVNTIRKNRFKVSGN
ncbi:phytanoyl-CoA dioxygenase family protein [Dyadobacter sp. CY326]|uniref:phytanoyl-CoA dioxygenase family protein n=1 Tax=Dyadobacter sp. CY326 TaxID=2907300 RepID=UPI001F1E7826|nr:phytanoyl-CoA dioxygenase family protein [Dyadobacter sp. CY326]MCE7066141.1 phytanoyl-CoA dioxygenase family protein [Dyadobacter sp. CY326]